MPEFVFFLADFEQVFYEITFFWKSLLYLLVVVHETFFLARNNAATQKIKGSSGSRKHRKLTFSSTFCNVGGCKAQIYLRLQLTKNGCLL